MEVKIISPNHNILNPNLAHGKENNWYYWLALKKQWSKAEHICATNNFFYTFFCMFYFVLVWDFFFLVHLFNLKYNHCRKEYFLLMVSRTGIFLFFVIRPPLSSWFIPTLSPVHWVLKTIFFFHHNRIFISEREDHLRLAPFFCFMT